MNPGTESESAGKTPTASAGTRHPGWSAARRRAVELLIVFFGVYAAFLLNRMDTDRRDANRRAQILDAVEREMDGAMGQFEQNVAQSEAQLAEFDHQLASGAMPRLSIIYTNSSYSATDDATLLQSGGLELLDMETVERLRKVNDTQRAWLEGVHNQFELSLAELPNHQPEDFYDPATHQLKSQYQWYPYSLHNLLAAAKAALAAQKELLAHVKAIQHPGAAVTPKAAPAPTGQTTP